MQELTETGRQRASDIADRHGVSLDAVLTLMRAINAGGGAQAQFNHPDLGGMGQWSRGGMVMVGDMFNNGLKALVDALCNDVAEALASGQMFRRAASSAPRSMQSQSQGGGYSYSYLSAADDWPEELGQPGSVGSQNDLHYATFPATRRLAIRRGGRLEVFDTGDHVISGFSQQQGGDQTITFTSQHGLVRVADLPRVEPAAEAAPAATKKPDASHAQSPAPAQQRRSAPPSAPDAPAPESAPSESDQIFATLERLADLRDRGILSEDEFASKKTELLARL